MSARIAKTIARQQEKIAEGQYYEAHQQLRVIAARYTKQSNWHAAIDVLYEGALALLRAGQGGSGGDLALLMIETMDKGEVAVTAESKGKVFAVLRAFPPDEPTRKRVVHEAMAWTVAYGDFAHGDPELHDVAGKLYAEDCDVYEAERHLALGTKDAPETLARLEYTWYAQDESHTAALYAARAVFPYLLTRNLRSAHKAYLLFTARLSADKGALGVQEVSSTASDVRVYPALPLLNFLGLLLLAAQRGGADSFRALAKHYAPHIKEVGAWDEALAHVGEIWFGIRIPRAGNPLFDMMSGMLFGGGGGGGSGSAKPGTPKVKAKKSETAPAPPSVDVD